MAETLGSVHESPFRRSRTRPTTEERTCKPDEPRGNERGVGGQGRPSRGARLGLDGHGAQPPVHRHLRYAHSSRALLHAPGRSGNLQRADENSAVRLGLAKQVFAAGKSLDFRPMLLEGGFGAEPVAFREMIV